MPKSDFRRELLPFFETVDVDCARSWTICSDFVVQKQCTRIKLCTKIFKIRRSRLLRPLYCECTFWVGVRLKPSIRETVRFPQYMFPLASMAYASRGGSHALLQNLLSYFVEQLCMPKSVSRWAAVEFIEIVAVRRARGWTMCIDSVSAPEHRFKIKLSRNALQISSLAPPELARVYWYSSGVGSAAIIHLWVRIGSLFQLLNDGRRGHIYPFPR